uniref:Uncharacterized protein n=1 Tax=Strombidium inclinatum TaxID=197538 RepID=A0A7S3IG41_9SPIT|eukprot:CAMPEP_0170506962 /NCGR_PEP_ID=MMETSP0208-20121228/57050_1 /TAXON_ID=197538 /ORGANISM="Strombidium inclinatum, Strain S3" /LENGTH=142 /DNA_ID=CAMNT_0010788853 /DNA_START=3245 /DNA_END=3673 /DNA_ORIENTATION=+
MKLDPVGLRFEGAVAMGPVAARVRPVRNYWALLSALNLQELLHFVNGRLHVLGRELLLGAASVAEAALASDDDLVSDLVGGLAWGPLLISSWLVLVGQGVEVKLQILVLMDGVFSYVEWVLRLELQGVFRSHRGLLRELLHH